MKQHRISLTRAFALISFLSINFISISQDFEVSPVSINFTAEPGESQVKEISVTNHSSKNYGFNLVISEASTENSISKEKSDYRSCSDWLTLTENFFELKPNESKKVTLSIQVPANQYNSRRATIHVQSAKENTSFSADKKLSTGLLVTGRITINISQSPSSNTKYLARIAQFSETTKAGDSDRFFSVRVENVGDKLINGKLSMVASNFITAEEFKIPTKANIKLHPDRYGLVKLSIPNNFELPPGKYALAVILDYHRNHNLEGSQIIIDVLPKVEPVLDKNE